eukprot:TRINITY_DN3491_c0_g2_i4.p1 TRINITY_DN3491_c0_g2~~TRINITY_DN3491_c0_g2_i4.p1  ORF type:complete len:671 (-),score=43.42 TRINITY_DN3491_c0_g2_i4:558-2549(-)
MAKTTRQGSGGLISKDEQLDRHLFVLGLDEAISWQDLKDHFRQYGRVVYGNVNCDFKGVSKGTGDVIFETKEEAQQAIENLNGTWILSKKISVKWFKPRGHARNRQRSKGLQIPKFRNAASPGLKDRKFKNKWVRDEHNNFSPQSNHSHEHLGSNINTVHQRQDSHARYDYSTHDVIEQFRDRDDVAQVKHIKIKDILHKLSSGNYGNVEVKTENFQNDSKQILEKEIPFNCDLLNFNHRVIEQDNDGIQGYEIAKTAELDLIAGQANQIVAVDQKGQANIREREFTFCDSQIWTESRRQHTDLVFSENPLQIADVQNFHNDGIVTYLGRVTEPQKNIQTLDVATQTDHSLDMVTRNNDQSLDLQMQNDIQPSDMGAQEQSYMDDIWLGIERGLVQFLLCSEGCQSVGAVMEFMNLYLKEFKQIVNPRHVNLYELLLNSPLYEIDRDFVRLTPSIDFKQIDQSRKRPREKDGVASFCNKKIKLTIDPHISSKTQGTCIIEKDEEEKDEDTLNTQANYADLSIDIFNLKQRQERIEIKERILQLQRDNLVLEKQKIEQLESRLAQLINEESDTDQNEHNTVEEQKTLANIEQGYKTNNHYAANKDEIHVVQSSNSTCDDKNKDEGNNNDGNGARQYNTSQQGVVNHMKAEVRTTRTAYTARKMK